MKQIGLIFQDVFEWAVVIGAVGSGVWVMVKLFDFIYKVSAGTYHLLDKLIDKL